MSPLYTWTETDRNGLELTEMDRTHARARAGGETDRGTGLQVVRTALKGPGLSDVEDETVQRAAARTEINK